MPGPSQLASQVQYIVLAQLSRKLLRHFTQYLILVQGHCCQLRPAAVLLCTVVHSQDRTGHQELSLPVLAHVHNERHQQHPLGGLWQGETLDLEG